MSVLLISRIPPTVARIGIQPFTRSAMPHRFCASSGSGAPDCSVCLAQRSTSPPLLADFMQQYAATAITSRWSRDPAEHDQTWRRLQISPGSDLQSDSQTLK